MKNKLLVSCLATCLSTGVFANDIKLTGEFSELYGNPFMKIIKENKTNTVNICSKNEAIKLPVESNLDNTNFMSQIKHKNSYIIDNKTIENVLEDYFSEDNNVKKSCGEYEVNINSGKIILTYTDFENNQLEILQKVIHRILESYYEKPREIKLLFYYPSDEYVSFLMTQDELMFSDEIDCRDLFDGNDSREKILVFDVG